MSARAVALERTDYASQVQQTRQLLDTIDDTSLVDLTSMGIRNIRALKQRVAEIFPASNLPLLLLQGLIHLEDRTLNQERVAADLRVLFRGIKQISLYGTFMAAPAMVIHGYQNLLALAGKDIDSAFPDGPWQFYTQFGLREDAARHCVETIGFQQVAFGMSDLDQATCWVYAAMHMLFSYDGLLANEWDERVRLRLVDDLLAERAALLLGPSLPRKIEERERAINEQVELLRRTYRIRNTAAEWALLRPYGSPPDTSPLAYVDYRHRRFHTFFDNALRYLPDDVRSALEKRFEARRAHELPLYQHQLTLLMSLDADQYEDQRNAIPLEDAQIALLISGRYHLLPVCARDERGHLLVGPLDGWPNSVGSPMQLTPQGDGTYRDRSRRSVTIDRHGMVRAAGELVGRLRPPPLNVLKGQIDAILREGQRTGSVFAADAVDFTLAQAPRDRQRQLRSTLNATTQRAIGQLKSAPIVINWDTHDSAQPLGALRHTRRGCGDHGLTLLRTDRSVVFDMSHVVFDAMWGMALAEIMTRTAAGFAWQVARSRSTRSPAVAPLALTATPAFREAVRTSVRSVAEANAETTVIDVHAIIRLRKRLPKIELELTVNDLLLLARCAHAASYQPGKRAKAALAAIAGLPDGQALVEQIKREFAEEREINPPLLIPMDASAVDPRMRIFPATFINPQPTLPQHLIDCERLVQELRRNSSRKLRNDFDQKRRELYEQLQEFNAALRSLKDVTMRGQSFTTASLRLFGHLPGAMQNLIDLIPQKISILNEIIKGREVFSNVGKVAANVYEVATVSSISRFSSSRDDGDTKLLVWGMVTDASGRLSVTLRDFRPHVAPLRDQGRLDLAHELAQDYLDAYADSANQLVRCIQRVMAYR